MSVTKKQLSLQWLVEWLYEKNILMAIILKYTESISLSSHMKYVFVK